MMLNERQKQIFLCLDENKNSFIKGIELANKVNCSLKTLQNTVKEMKIILEYIGAILILLNVMV